jgi:hypothetical protein
LLPVQCSASTCELVPRQPSIQILPAEPIAMSGQPDMSGCDMTTGVQCVPAHRYAATSPSPFWLTSLRPTAQTFVAELASMLYTVELIGCAAHVLPFHCHISVTHLVPVQEIWPVTQASLALSTMRLSTLAPGTDIVCR